MERRSFFGTALGIFLDTKVEFIPEEVEGISTFEKNSLECFAQRIKLHTLIRDRKINTDKFKMFAETLEGFKFYSPAIDKIEALDKNYLGLKFIAKPIKVNKEVIIEGAGLINDQNCLIGEGNFSSPVCILPGDRLFVTYSSILNW